MNAGNFAHLDDKGREQFRRILEGVLRAQGVRTKLVPEEQLTKAVTEGRGLELVRHLTALRKDGGRV